MPYPFYIYTKYHLVLGFNGAIKAQQYGGNMDNHYHLQ
ncbi:hypothetical protein PMAG_a0024 [Pseudoalteromonas mariniglutinosa NCIMB 1770]|nr:hypothetical protein [Pseudoalteromonas mariniglutinosa NCIMB 1770]